MSRRNKAIHLLKMFRDELADALTDAVLDNDEWRNLDGFSMSVRPSEHSGTRADLLDTALDLFGQDGFMAVSTRALTDRAGANLAAIQ